MAFRFLPKRLHKELIANRNTKETNFFQPYPVVKLFMTDEYGIWVFSKVLPINYNVAYGLIDRGDGNPHLGYVDLYMLARMRGKMGLPVERDLNFRPNYTLNTYHAAAVLAREFVDDEWYLNQLLNLEASRPQFPTPKPSLN